jgi:hypothetical protein
MGAALWWLSAKQIGQSSSSSTGTSWPVVGGADSAVGKPLGENGSGWLCQANSTAWKRIAKIPRHAVRQRGVSSPDLFLIPLSTKPRCRLPEIPSASIDTL